MFTVMVDRLLVCNVVTANAYGTRFTGGGVQLPSRIEGGVLRGE
jgi:hypothetical protein